MTENGKILIIRLSSIGDIVLTSPLVRVLRQRYPSSKIDFVVQKKYAELIRFNPNLNLCYEFDSTKGFPDLRSLKAKIRKEGYDIIIDIHNNFRSRYLRANIGASKVVTINKRIFERIMLVKFKKSYYRGIVSVADRYIEPMQSFGIQNDGRGLELFIPKEIRNNVKIILAQEGIQSDENIIGFCQSSKHVTKCWPFERFAEFGIRLAKEWNKPIVLFGGPEDAQKCAMIVQLIQAKLENHPIIDFSGKLSLLETAEMMKACNVILTNDSGLMHIAAAMKRKIVAIFGSTVEEFGFYPIGTECIVLNKQSLKCRPCSHIGLDSCPKKHFCCMMDIQIEEVCQAIKTILV